MGFDAPAPIEPPTAMAAAAGAVTGGGDGGLPATVASARIPADATIAAVDDHRIRFVMLPAAARPAPAGAGAAVKRGNEAGGMPPAVDAPSTIDDSPAIDDPSAIDDEVIAAHDARIRVLRDRVAGLQAEGAGEPVLGGLLRRLRRAEAARRLASARIGGGDAACRDEGRGCMASVAAPVRLATLAGPAAIALPPVRRSVRLQVNTHARRSTPALASPRRLAGMTHGFVAPPHHAPIVRFVDHRRLAARSPLVRARRSLAAARMLLDGRAIVVRAGPVGLWRWAGSEAWTLMPDPGQRATVAGGPV